MMDRNQQMQAVAQARTVARRRSIAQCPAILGSRARSRASRGWFGLLMAAALVSGCANSNYKLTSQQKTTLQAVTDERVANAPLEASPKILPETHVAAGKMFEAQGDLAKAIQQYRKAIAVNHRNVVAYQRLGYLLGRTGDHAEAVAVLGRAVSLDPSNAALRNNLGYELMHEKRWKDAETELRTAIRLKPGFARAHVNLAMVLSQTDRFEEAMEEFQRVLSEADAHYNLGLLQRGQKRYADAKTSFERVLRINPAFAAARQQLLAVEEQLAVAPRRDAVRESASAGTEPVATTDVGSARSVDAEPGFTVKDARADRGAIPAEGPQAIEGVDRASEVRAATVENRIDAESDDDGVALTATDESTMVGEAPPVVRSDSAVTGVAGGSSGSSDWTIPFGLSMARRLSTAGEKVDAEIADVSRSRAEAAATPYRWEEDGPGIEESQRIRRADTVGEIEKARDPWTQAWVEDMRDLDSRLTIVRNQIACLDEEIARNEAETQAIAVAVHVADAFADGAGSIDTSSISEAEGDEVDARVTLDETGVYARVLGAGGFAGIDESGSDSSMAPWAAGYSPADVADAVDESWSRHEVESATEDGPNEVRTPKAVPVRYEERSGGSSGAERSDRGARLWGSSLEEASAALSTVRNEIHCRESSGGTAYLDGMESWSQIVSWPEEDVEPSWCDPAEYVPLCDPRWDDEDVSDRNPARTSMKFRGGTDPRYVRPLSD